MENYYLINNVLNKTNENEMKWKEKRICGFDCLSSLIHSVCVQWLFIFWAEITAAEWYAVCAYEFKENELISMEYEPKIYMHLYKMTV